MAEVRRVGGRLMTASGGMLAGDSQSSFLFLPLPWIYVVLLLLLADVECVFIHSYKEHLVLTA
jgi:hypothetical protein